MSGVPSRPRTGIVKLERLGVTLDSKEQTCEVAWSFRKIIQVQKLHGASCQRDGKVIMQLRKGWQDVLCPELGQEFREFVLAQSKKYY